MKYQDYFWKSMVPLYAFAWTFILATSLRETGKLQPAEVFSLGDWFSFTIALVMSFALAYGYGHHQGKK